MVFHAHPNYFPILARKVIISTAFLNMFKQTLYNKLYSNSLIKRDRDKVLYKFNRLDA